MVNHTDLLNFIAVKNNCKNYLEIGINVKRNNFDHIICPTKIGVDPNPKAAAEYQVSSDVFFNSFLPNDFAPDFKFDLIFIDGLHEASQVKKDFENALKVLSSIGHIVLHDCAPEFEVNSHFPRDKRGVWNGDVYKFICTLGEYDGIEFLTVDFDHGCTVVWKNPGKIGKPRPKGELDWLYYQVNKDLFRLISPEKFIELANKI